MPTITEYHKPADMENALTLLRRKSPPTVPLAGGVWLNPRIGKQVSAQAVYFRRGATLVRVFLDPGASPPPGELLARAQEIDRALRQGGPP